MPIIPTICEQYAGQAAFLWSQRDLAVNTPTGTLEDLAALDERLEAHLDGLRVAGRAGWPFCLAALNEGLGGEVFTAAVIALWAGDAAAIAAVRTAAARSPALTREFIAALGWLSDARFQARIGDFLGRPEPLWRHVGVAARAIRRQAGDADLAAAFHDPDPRLRARAARAAGELARVDLHPALTLGLTADEPGTRLWSAWSLALLGEREQSLTVLASLIRTPGAAQARALPVLARLLGPDGIRHWWDLPVGADDAAARLRILGLAASGSPAAIPWLIERMRDSPSLARRAGSALCLITGLDLAAAGLAQPPSAGVAVGPNDDPAEDTVALDPNDGLPWPDAARVGDWWGDHQSGFDAGTRYLGGLPVTSGHCWALLRDGPQQARVAAALELALLDPAQPLFETRAPAWRQRAWLAGHEH